MAGCSRIPLSVPSCEIYPGEMNDTCVIIEMYLADCWLGLAAIGLTYTYHLLCMYTDTSHPLPTYHPNILISNTSNHSWFVYLPCPIPSIPGWFDFYRIRFRFLRCLCHGTAVPCYVQLTNLVATRSTA
jgi:hypothetical protein